MSSRHLVMRAKEHLNLSSVKYSVVKNHLINYKVCSVPTSTFTNFKVLRKCSSEFDTKINETLLIKKLNPSLKYNYIVGELLCY